ncbi:hypothetical protein XENOCAPTIV_023565 [Xenoophorus captivus]|uniref:ATPase AAA-type core domain-containing protein n=1 Tax=Xenoophorus captivus TaxID=1517983 RepID=A0ABV0QWB9_9TELE
METLRRSSRTKTSTKNSYCEDEKSKLSEENISTTDQEPPRRGGRTRRAQRSRIKEDEDEMKEKTKPKLKSALISSEEDSVVVVDDLNLEADSSRKEWDCGEEDYQDAEDTLCNTMLITGPTGVGKTAAVYACAQELGFKVQLHHIQKIETYVSQHLLPHFLIYPFKVFEVNASSQRSGRLILSQLKEATQSHQVDSQGVNAHKPTYFNSYGLTSSSSCARPGSSPSMDDTVNQ